VKTLANGQTVWELTGETGKVTTTKLGNMMTATTTRDDHGKLIRLNTATSNNAIVRKIEYTFDSFGNLIERTGLLGQSYSIGQENFEYDHLNRLTTVRIGSTDATPTMTIGYAPNGNINNKTGIGTYTYDASRPHAVESVDNTAGLISNSPQSITYTAFGKAETITEAVGNVTYDLNFTYGPDQQRWKTVLSKNGSAHKTTIFAPSYEKITESNTVKQFYYLHGADGLAAVYVKRSGQNDQIYYAHTDHLGSILKLTDASGNAVFSATYDAWGKQTVTTNTFAFHRGYTGHEHLPEFGLINMNGRMYDPILGRMLSPDNYVQAPGNAQSYNRYSYCLNNPLIYKNIINSKLSNGITPYVLPNGARTGNSGSVMRMDVVKWQSVPQYAIRYRSASSSSKKSYTDPWGLFTYKVEEKEGDPLNESTWGKNLFGLVYPGARNPRTQEGKDYYGNFDNLSPLDFPGLQHDQAYDRIEATGAMSLFTDTRAAYFDLTFVVQHSVLAFELLMEGYLLNSIESSLLGVGLHAATTPKTEPFFALSSLETGYFNRYIDDLNWTSSQKNWAKVGNYAVMMPNYITAGDLLTGGAVSISIGSAILGILALFGL
jgi:RHS repeat-associated protein